MPAGLPAAPPFCKLQLEPHAHNASARAPVCQRTCQPSACLATTALVLQGMQEAVAAMGWDGMRGQKLCILSSYYAMDGLVSQYGIAPVRLARQAEAAAAVQAGDCFAYVGDAGEGRLRSCASSARRQQLGCAPLRWLGPAALLQPAIGWPRPPGGAWRPKLCPHARLFALGCCRHAGPGSGASGWPGPNHDSSM